MNSPTPEPKSMQNEVNLCKSCNTAKHLNQEGLCGRCAPEPELNVEAAVRDILRLRVLGELNHMVWATTDQKVDAMLALLQQVSDQRVKAYAADLKQFNGAYIGIGGRRVDKMVHHDIIDRKLAEHLTHE